MDFEISDDETKTLNDLNYQYSINVDSPYNNHTDILNTANDVDSIVDEKTPLLNDKEVVVEDDADKLITGFVPSTVTQSIFNSVNLLIGVGILSLPYAFCVSGWIVGVGMLLTLCLLTRYTALVLAKCMDVNKKYVSYADVGEGAFGSRGRGFISVFFLVELAIASVALVILSADSISALMPHWDSRLIKLGVFLVFTPSTWGKSLSHLTAASMCGVVTILCLFSILLTEGLTHADDSAGSLLVPAHTDMWPAHWRQTPLCIGLVSAGFSGHAVFASIKAQMARPKKFPTVVNVSYVITALLYLAFAAMGYLMFGKETMVEVSQNLPRIENYPRVLAVFTILVVMVNPFTKYALTIQPVCLTAEQFLSHKAARIVGNHPDLMRIINRTAISALIVTGAIIIPGFDKIMSILGSFFSMMVSVIIPLAMYIQFFKASLTKVSLYFHLILLILSIAVALVGTFYGLFF